ncbi:MAG: hypothetical protein QNJ98_09990 [Planctomycetota bacterium]|nr:hypothetical protein [Planctomycetota bacterium]
MAKTLCPRCLSSVEETDMVLFQGLQMCTSCADVANKRPEETPVDPRNVTPGYRPPPPPPDVRHTMRVEGTFWERLVDDMRAWCVGRMWWVRVPVLVYLVYVCVRYTAQPLHPAQHDFYASWFDGINFGFHELGHYVFRPFGRFMHIFGGTLLQCLMPLVAGFFLLRQRDYFGVAFCLGWLSTNFSGVAIYMADAQIMQLTIVAPGVGVVDSGMKGQMHDWRNLLNMLGLLKHTDFLATLTKIFAVLTMAVAVGFGGWVCYTMARVQPRQPGPPIR